MTHNCLGLDQQITELTNNAIVLFLQFYINILDISSNMKIKARFFALFSLSFASISVLDRFAVLCLPL